MLAIRFKGGPFAPSDTTEVIAREVLADHVRSLMADTVAFPFLRLASTTIAACAYFPDRLFLTREARLAGLIREQYGGTLFERAFFLLAAPAIRLHSVILRYPPPGIGQ